MVTIAEVASGLSLAMKTLKDLREIETGVNDATFKLKIAELTGNVADAKIALTDLQEELRERDQTISKLRAALKTKEETIKVNGFHYVAYDDKPAGFPMCTVCVEDGHFQRLTAILGTLSCPRCKAKYQDVKIYPNPASV